jgi:hypothetical protein
MSFDRVRVCDRDPGSVRNSDPDPGTTEDEQEMDARMREVARGLSQPRTMLVGSPNGWQQVSVPGHVHTEPQMWTWTRR